MPMDRFEQISRVLIIALPHWHVFCFFIGQQDVDQARQVSTSASNPRPRPFMTKVADGAFDLRYSNIRG